jgi:hypothetical protein
MKGGAVKGDEDSNDESSTDGDESDSVVSPTFPAVNDQKYSPPAIIFEHFDFIKCAPNRNGNTLCSSSRYSAGSRFHFLLCVNLDVYLTMS